MGQLILLSAAGLVYVSCYYSNLLPSWSNMLNPQFMPVLALIPGIHLLLILVPRHRGFDSFRSA
jgi:hypothetical protein